MKTVLIVALLAVLTGCATSEQRRAAFAGSLDAWIGKTSDQLVLARGLPTSTYELSTKKRILEYLRRETVTRGGGTYTTSTPVLVPDGNGGGRWVSVPQQHVDPVFTATFTCKVTFIVTAAGLVESWKSEGDDCY